MSNAIPNLIAMLSKVRARCFMLPHVTLLRHPLILLGCFVVLTGCDSNPHKVSAVTEPKAAKDALIDLASRSPDELYGRQLGQLQMDPLPKPGTNQFVLGGFDCDLEMHRFSILFRGHDRNIFYKGKFQLADDGTWKATIVDEEERIK
jgi:hypothetical protein